MPFEPLLRFVVEFVRGLQVLQVRVVVQRVVDIPVAQVVDIPVEVPVVDIPVEVQVAVRVRIERVPLWVAPLSLRRALH